MVDGLTVLKKSDAPADVGQVDIAYGASQSGDYLQVYRNPNNAPVHQFIADGLSGGGGFSGDIDSEKMGYKYSYLHFWKSEYQYYDRIRMSQYYNFFNRAISAKVNPIFASKPISTTVKLTEKYEENHPFIDWCKLADGYNPLQFIEQSYAKNGTAHGCAYLAMMPSEWDATQIILKHYSPNDVLDYDTDRGRPVFYRMLDYQDGDKVYATEYTYNGSSTTITKKVAVVYGGQDLEQAQWKDAGYSVTVTAVSDFIVNMIPFEPLKFGEIVPKNPKNYSTLKIVADIWQKMSLKGWTIAKQAHSKFYMYGKTSGVNAFLDSYIEIPIGADGKAPPAPDFASPDEELPRVAQEDIDTKISYMRDIFREDGVSTVEHSTSQSQSGDSKSYDFQATQLALQSTVQRLQVGFRWIYQTWFAYNGLDASKYTEIERHYPMNFFPKPEQALVDLLDVVDKLESRGLVESAKEVYKKIMIVATGGEVSEERMEELMNEINTISEMAKKEEIDTQDTVDNEA